MIKKTITILCSFLFIIVMVQLTGIGTSIAADDNLGNVLNSMVNGNANFPTKFGVISQMRIREPDLEMKVRSDYLNRVIEAYLKSPISLEQDGALSKCYITVRKVYIKPDPKRNILILTVTGGSLSLGESLKALDGKLVIKKAEFEVAPLCRKDKHGQVSLDLDIRCVYLDINGTSRLIDIGIAHILQEQFLNKHPIEPIFLTQFFRSYTTENGRGHRVQNILSQLAVVITSEGIDFRSKWDVK